MDDSKRPQLRGLGLDVVFVRGVLLVQLVQHRLVCALQREGEGGREGGREREREIEGGREGGRDREVEWKKRFNKLHMLMYLIVASSK